MDPTAPCAFCGTVLPTRQMSITGHGLRCVPCDTRAAISELETGGKTGGMGDHFTRPELEDLVRTGVRDAIGGFAVALGGLGVGAAGFVVSGFVIALGGSFFATGLGFALRGLLRRSQARATLASMPDARLLR